MKILDLVKFWVESNFPHLKFVNAEDMGEYTFENTKAEPNSTPYIDMSIGPEGFNQEPEMGDFEAPLMENEILLWTSPANYIKLKVINPNCFDKLKKFLEKV